MRRRTGRQILARGARTLFARRGMTLRIDAEVFWGDHLRVELPDSVSELVYRFGIYEPPVTWFLLSQLRPGMTVFDVGAHLGYFTSLASHLVGEAGAVHAFEPTPDTFALLSLNAATRSNVHVNPSAAWSIDTTLQLTDFGRRFSGHNSLFAPRFSPGTRMPEPASIHRVEARALDGYGVTPHFVRIDAESAEAHIIDGMTAIMRTKPMLCLEVGDMGVPDVPSSRELVTKVIELGYDVFEYADCSLTPHTLRDQYEYDNLLMLPTL
jgi:FkbM family methyltransferase